MPENLDAETLLTLSILGEVENQCLWALARIRDIHKRLEMNDRLMKKHPSRFAEWDQNRRELFGSIQSFLTCAGIVDSLLTGRGPPRPKGLVGLTEEERASVRREIQLPDTFEVGGRPQRNALVHIEERLIPWSRPGGMRGDFAMIRIDGQQPKALQQTLRVFDRRTFRFAVVGEVCNLAEIAASLEEVLRASSNAHTRILAKVNSKNQEVGATSKAGPP